MRIKLSSRADKSLFLLERGDKNAVQLIKRKIAELAETPFPPDAKKLRGKFRDVWRTKAGDHHRILYAVDKDADTVRIINAAPRAKVYE